jgi:hypothetical protein
MGGKRSKWRIWRCVGPFASVLRPAIGIPRFGDNKGIVLSEDILGGRLEINK